MATVVFRHAAVKSTLDQSGDRSASAARAAISNVLLRDVSKLRSEPFRGFRFGSNMWLEEWLMKDRKFCVEESMHPTA